MHVYNPTKEEIQERSFFEQFDDFGHPISLTFRGESTFKTMCGGLLSILAKTLSLTVAIIVLIDLFNPVFYAKVLSETQKVASDSIPNVQLSLVDTDSKQTTHLKDEFGLLMMVSSDKFSSPENCDDTTKCFKNAPANSEVRFYDCLTVKNCITKSCPDFSTFNINRFKDTACKSIDGFELNLKLDDTHLIDEAKP